MNLSSAKRIKLAKMLSFIKEITTDKGLLVVDGQVEVGNEVFVYDNEQNAPVPAPDGTYKTDELEIAVEGGIITEVKDIEVEEPIVTEPEAETEPETEEEKVETEEETPVEEEPTTEEPVVDEEKEQLKARIAELEALVEEKNTKIAELQAVIDNYKAKEETPAAEPAEEEAFQMSKQDEKQSKVLGIVSYLKHNQ